MKNLYIIRHAKSSWKDLNLSDFDRPLNKRGKKDAPFMGELLKNKNIIPDIIISSPALRAKKTAQTIASKINFNNSIIYDNNIYEASLITLINILKIINDTIDTIFLFGHNPSLNMLVNDFINDFYENIPTCGIIQIEFNCNSWQNISSDNAKLINFDYPKKFY